MALPGAPANVVVRPGHNPGDVIVECDAVSASPVVLNYTAYIDSATGVDSTSAFRAQRTVLKLSAPHIVFRNKFTWREVFATVKATNSEGDGVDATEASGKARV